MAGNVDDLVVFRRAYALSLELHRASLGWPNVEQYGGIAGQLRRSSKSVCALLMEGGGRLRRSRTEFERYLVMSLGSADETRLWCRYMPKTSATRPMSRQPPGASPARRSPECCKACSPGRKDSLLL